MYVCIHNLSLYICRCVYMYIYIYICMRIYTYTYVHTYTTTSRRALTISRLAETHSVTGPIPPFIRRGPSSSAGAFVVCLV